MRRVSQKQTQHKKILKIRSNKNNIHESKDQKVNLINSYSINDYIYL
jgi:hypothetical protein